MLVQKMPFGGDEHELRGRGTAVDAEVGVARISGDVLERQVAAAVPRHKLLVFLPVFEQRVARHDVVAALCRRDARNEFCKRHRLFRARRERRADAHEAGRVFGEHGVFVVEVQRLFERFPQSLDEVQRSAQKEHLALDAPALRQARNGLVDDRLKDARRNVLFARALVEQRLDVRFGEHAAAGSDRVHLFRFERKLVHLGDGDVQKGRHLVDERARAARAAAVHALFGAARDEDDLRVLAAEFHRRVGVGVVPADGFERRLHLLHEGHAAALGKPQPRRAGNAHRKIAAAEFFPDRGKLREHALLDAREVPLVARVYNFALIFRQYAHLDGGRTDVDPHMQCHIFHPYRARRPCGAPRRLRAVAGIIAQIRGKFKNVYAVKYGGNGAFFPVFYRTAIFCKQTLRNGKSRRPPPHMPPVRCRLPPSVVLRIYKFAARAKARAALPPPSAVRTKRPLRNKALPSLRDLPRGRGALLREFPFRRFAAAQMPLVQVFIQHRAHGGVQLRIDLGEPFGHVLMHGRFARTEVFGAGAHRCVRLQNVLRRAPRAALHILPHLHHPPSGDDTFYVGSCKLMTNGRMRRSLFVPRSL